MTTINDTVSFGVVMLAENAISAALLFDIIRRVALKALALRHPHVYWKSGIILFVYLLIMLIFTAGEGYICFDNYLCSTKPIELWKVSGRVFVTTLWMLANILHHKYTVNWGFNLFQEKKIKK